MTCVDPILLVEIHYVARIEVLSTLALANISPRLAGSDGIGSQDNVSVPR